MMITFTLEIKAKAEKIWPYYEEEAKRKEWEDDLEYLTLDGSFINGTKGKIKLQNLPEMNFELLDIIRNKLFSDRTFLPNGDEVRFSHILEEAGERTKVTHQVSIVKVNGEMKKEELPMLMGIFSDVPASMFKIKELVERK